MKRPQRISSTASSGRAQDLRKPEHGDIALVDQRIRNLEADRDAWRVAADEGVEFPARAEDGASSQDSIADHSLHRYTLRLVDCQAEVGQDASAAVARLGGEVIDSASGMLLFDSSSGVALAIAHELPNWLASPETLADAAARLNGVSQDRTQAADKIIPGPELRHAGHDAAFVDINVASELEEWSKTFDVTPNQLKLAVASSGGHPDTVQAYIKAGQAAARASRRRM